MIVIIFVLYIEKWLATDDELVTCTILTRMVYRDV